MMIRQLHIDDRRYINHIDKYQFVKYGNENGLIYVLIYNGKSYFRLGPFVFPGLAES